MASDAPTLTATPREVAGSRAARRLRRSGHVPGVVYGGEGEPLAVQLDTLTLKRVLAHAGAVIDLQLDGAATPVLIKDVQHHPVTGEPLHADFVRVRLDRPVQATAVIELQGVDDAPGVKEGGVLEHVTREITVEALPRELPETIPFDASGMSINDTVTLAELQLPSGVTLIDDPETTLATLTPPRLEVESDEEIETETERVGEEEAAAEEVAEEGGGEPSPDTETGPAEG